MMTRMTSYRYVLVWIVVILILVFALFFAILYGHSFGYVKSMLWLAAFAISFLVTSLITDPIKLVSFAIFYTFKTRQPPPENHENEPPFVTALQTRRALSKNLYQRVWIQYSSLIIPRISKKYLTKREHYILYYRELSGDLFMFSMYMVTLLLVVLGSRDDRSIQSSRYAREHLVEGRYVRYPVNNISDDQAMFAYLRNVLLPTMHDGKNTM